MNLIPDPLHPAVVHFPIVLILIGALAAVAAVFWRGGQLPKFAAMLLIAGALGAWAAVESGESGGGLLEKVSPQMETLVEAHEMWAKRALALAVVAALAAAGAALARQWPRLARVVAIVAAIASITAVYAVYETGHRGGALVYQHGAGVELAAGGTSSGSGPGNALSQSAPAEHKPKHGDVD